MREIYFTPESTKLSSLLFQFQTSKERIGLVVDEYGDIQGLVTLEDILEEIVENSQLPFYLHIVRTVTRNKMALC